MRRWRVASFAIGLGLLMLLAGCSPHTSAEAQVKAAVKAAAAAAADTDAGTLGDYLDPDFDGNGGDLDAHRLTGMLRLAHFRGERVRVLLGPISVERRGQRMVATFTVTLGGGGRLFPDRLGVYKVESAWRLEGDDWKCYQATWKESL